MITVAFDRADVEARPGEPVGVMLCLTPAAFAAATETGLDAINTLAVFSDRDHARCAAAIRRATRDFDAAAARAGFPPSIETVGRQTAFYVAGITRRLVRTVRQFPARVRDRAGGWVEVNDAAGLLAALFPRILDFGLAHRLPGRRPPLPYLYRFLFRLAARRAASRGPIVITPGSLKLGFAEAFERNGTRLAQLAPARGTLDDYRSLKGAWSDSAPRLRAAPVARGDSEFRRVMLALEGVESAFSDPVQRAGWRLYLPYLRSNVRNMLGLVRDGETLFRGREVIGAASYEANGWTSAALFEAARRAGREAIVLNHNCHALAADAPANAVIGRLYRQRKQTRSVTEVVHWSPSDRAVSAQVSATSGVNPREVACRLDYPAPALRPNGRFRVLHAANYQNWSDFFPWVAETSDEFVRGIRELSAAAAGISDIELTIRVRAKAEVDQDVIRDNIVRADNVTVCSTDDEFLEQLSDSDLLVSFFSTTVMQALQMGKPVLLWGSAHRFHQVAARREPPTHNERGPVYAVTKAADLRAMLTAIREQHHGNPLTDDEVAGYRFSPEVPDAQGIARILASGAGL